MEGALWGTAPLFMEPHINISKWYHKVNTVAKVLKDRSTQGLCMVWKLEPVPVLQQQQALIVTERAWALILVTNVHFAKRAPPAAQIPTCL